MNEVVLRYGNTDLNIYDGYDLTKSSQEVTYSDLTCEFTGHSAEELPERYQEAKIIEKQKVNQEVETIQYEEKNKIKEATFDSEINENLVVDKVYGSTSQETREESKSVLTGSEIVVNDTYIDNKTQFIIDGNSEQETTEGKNKFNLNYIEQSAAKVVTDTGVNLTNCWGTQAFNNEKVLKTFKPNTTYTMKAKAKVVSRPSTQGSHQSATFLLYREGSSPLGLVAVDLIKMKDKETIALNIEKEYVTTFTTPADLSEVRLLAYSFYGNNDGSTTYVPSGKIDLTDIMLVEGTYTMDNFPSYEPYTGGIPSPNPDYPQEIEVIGDNINIFNKSASMYSVGAAKTELDTGVRLTQTVAGNYKYCWLTLGQSELLGKTLTMQAKIFSSAQNISGLSLFYGNASTGAVVNSGYGLSSNGGNITFSILSTFPDNCDRVNLLLYVNVAGIGNIDDYVDFTDLKIEIGDKATLYSNYNSGSVGLEQSGINKLGLTNGTLRNGSGITVKELENGGISITGTASSDTNFQYIWKLKNIVKNNQLITLSNGTTGVTGLQVSLRDSSKNVISETWTNNGAVKSATLTTDAYYYQIQINSNITVNTTIYPMIVEGAYSETTLPAYEPYREKIITIDLQGNTLAKVGNVKDILKVNRNGEVKIEKNIGKVVLDGSENWKLYKTYLYTIIDDCALSPTISTKVATLLSDKFTATSLNDISNNANYGIAYNAFGDREQQKGVCFNVNDYFNSVATLKTWLPNNNVEVYYKLATPQIITLPSISPIELEQGTNIFKLISNLDTTIELTYNYISAMPSTETPSKINNTESINIKIQNESLFDIKELVKMSDNYSEVENGYIFSSKHDMYSDGVILATPITLPASLSYTVKNGTGTNFRFIFVYDDGSATSFTKYLSGTEADVTKNIVINNITKSGASKIVKICIDYSNAGTFTITNFMINEGTTAKPYIKHKEQNISFSLDKPLYENCYLAEDGIHYNRTQNVVNITSAVKLSNGNVAGVYDPPNKTSKQNNLLICSKAKFERTYKTNTVYENPASVVFVGEETDTLDTLKQKFDGAILEYELKNEIIVPYTEKQKRSWKNLQKLISYTGKNYVESTADIDIKCPTKIKKEIIPKIYEKLLFTGYVDDYSFNEMREKDVDIDINITLYSPMKMTTLRTATAVGTYELKSLIQKEILSPLIDDGFSIEELDITDRQLTVNYISETIEYCMNNLSNKFNFWWFIDEQKRIYIKDIDKLMNGEPDYIYDDTHSIAGLQYIKPITESDNYANVVNFKNVRIYEYSRLQLNGNTITQEHNPLISQQITTIKNGEQLDFNFPCDIKKENIIKSAESNGITQYFYGIYVKGTYSDNTTFEFSIGYDDINKTFETTDNVGFDGSENATEEFLLIRDSFFSNLITGFKLNNENKIIKSIEKITSDSALIWNVNKLYNDKAIADKRGIISKTGIVETTIDMNESWKTIQELREIGVSYMNKNSLDLNGTIELCTDRNVFQIGKTIYINKMLVNGTYIITQIKESLSNNDIDYYITAKNANMLDNYIDVFRGEASQESSDKTYQVYITHYEEENMYERHEVVQ